MHNEAIVMIFEFSKSRCRFVFCIHTVCLCGVETVILYKILRFWLYYQYLLNVIVFWHLCTTSTSRRTILSILSKRELSKQQYIENSLHYNDCHLITFHISFVATSVPWVYLYGVYHCARTHIITEPLPHTVTHNFLIRAKGASQISKIIKKFY